MVISLSTATSNPECIYLTLENMKTYNKGRMHILDLRKMKTYNKGQGERQEALSLCQLLAIFAEFNQARTTMCTTESGLHLKRKNGEEIKRKTPAPHKTFVP